MRCNHCGRALKSGATVCPRCRADVSDDARRKELRTSVIFVAVSIALMALMLFLVLTWEGSLVLMP